MQRSHTFFTDPAAIGTKVIKDRSVSPRHASVAVRPVGCTGSSELIFNRSGNQHEVVLPFGNEVQRQQRVQPVHACQQVVPLLVADRTGGVGGFPWA